MVVAVRSSNHHKPIIFLDLTDQNQVVIRFLSRDEHITIHRQDNGSLLKTHYFLEKPSSVWDSQRVETARSLGVEDPERHDNYVDQQILSAISDPHGHYLVGRRVDLDALTPGRRYYNRIAHTLNVGRDNFMLGIYLSTPQNRRVSSGVGIPTVFGDVCFEEET